MALSRLAVNRMATQLAPRRGGRPQDPVWDQVLVDDGIVSCLKCEKIIHTSGKTHVERVRYHFEKKSALAPAKVQEFQLRFALWFYTTDMAFQKAEHNSLVDALRVLTSSDIVPNRHQLATTLLDMCYDDLRSKLMLLAKGKRVTLRTDGYTDVNRNAVINYVLLVGDLTILLEGIYTGSDSHDAPFLTFDILRVMAKLNFVTIAATVTDKHSHQSPGLVDAVATEAQDLLPRLHLAHAASGGQGSHRPAAVARKLTEDCRKLVRFLKKSQQLWYELKRLQCMDDSARLRFGPRISTCEDQRAESEAPPRLRHRVARDFVQQLEKAIELLEVISKFQKAFEKNTKPPSDVYHMFLQLPEEFKKMEMPISELGKIQQILDERFNFVYGDAHEFIANWHGSGEEEAATVGLVKYLGGQRSTSLETKLIRQKQLTVAQYWGGLSQFPLLQDIALTVFASACSSAAAERNWWAHKYVHSKARNRLKDKSVEKLVFLLSNAKNFESDDLAFYDMIGDLEANSSEEEDNNEDSDYEYYSGQ
ncbi:hypothetical protein PR001_g7679 [Phytophthora rubi]|uniref:HAT C-terminal dimerisation domain-containing protein n=1 Tax=Phytophthora rubi TaxID=129364 RepID=A0A6A3NK82_9STRA|nr:hypothetical protein PR001_g7679 [Phytophthora rubi]KAE9041655.1 hypothetical protein PR002_g4329 [Phytophthora rubi]